MDKELIPLLNDQMEIGLPDGLSMPDLQMHLSQYFNKLIEHDFEKLVALLYKIDVDEIRLKKILKEQAGSDTADIIAKLVIERQLSKIQTRNQYK